MTSASYNGKGQRLQFQRHMENMKVFTHFPWLRRCRSRGLQSPMEYQMLGAPAWQPPRAALARHQIQSVLLGAGMKEWVPGLSKTTQLFGDRVQGQRPLRVVLMLWGIVRRCSGGEQRWGIKKFWLEREESISPETEAFLLSSNAVIKPSKWFWLGSEKKACSPGHSENLHVLPLHGGSGWPVSLNHGATGRSRNGLTPCLAVPSPS